MEIKEPSISGLYYKYGKTTNEDIRKYLNDIKIVQLTNRGIGTLFGYYPLNDKKMDEIRINPRNTVLKFGTSDIMDNPIIGLEILTKIKFLCKSTSRFALKPDIGEIFDQIPWRMLLEPRNEIKAICINNNYETLADTDGEHHIMEVTLLKKGE